MASTSEIHSKNFDDNNSFEVNILSACLSGVEIKDDTDLISCVEWQTAALALLS